MSFGTVVEKVSLTDLEAARRSSHFAKLRAAVLLGGAAAVAGCEIAYLPACEHECQAAGGNDTLNPPGVSAGAL